MFEMPARYTKEEVTERGEAIYQQQIRAKVEVENKGRFLVVDIETGEYEIDDDELTAIKRAYSKRPEGEFYLLRIGYPTAHRLGGRFLVQQP
jgi:hypothetical protein